MKKQILSLVIVLSFSVLCFSQEKLDKEIMTDFYYGFQNAIQTSIYFNAKIQTTFMKKYPDKTVYTISEEYKKVQFDFEHQVLVFDALYEFTGPHNEVILPSFLKDKFLLDSETAKIVSNYIIQKKYLN